MSQRARLWQEMAASNLRQLALIPDSHLERLNALYKLDRPLHERYIAWIKNLAVGDLGESWSVGKGASVSEVILGRLPYTLLLMLMAAVDPRIGYAKSDCTPSQ